MHFTGSKQQLALSIQCLRVFRPMPHYSQLNKLHQQQQQQQQQQQHQQQQQA